MRSAIPGGVFKYSHPGWFAIITFGIYCAMQTPELYAATDVSPGVDNVNYWTFLLMCLGDCIYISGWAKAHGMLKKLRFSHSVLPTWAVCFLLVMVFRHNVKDSLVWISYRYIISGEAADYREQMDERTAILLNDSLKEVVLPEINNQQGPLMHMAATDDPDSWFNAVIINFYEKDSVVVIDRNLYNERYRNGVPIK